MFACARLFLFLPTTFSARNERTSTHLPTCFLRPPSSRHPQRSRARHRMPFLPGNTKTSPYCFAQHRYRRAHRTTITCLPHLLFLPPTSLLLLSLPPYTRALTGGSSFAACRKKKKKKNTLHTAHRTLRAAHLLTARTRCTRDHACTHARTAHTTTLPHLHRAVYR